MGSGGGAGARQYRVITPSPYTPPPSCRGSCALQGREEAGVRGGWGDFARLCPGERVGREPLQPSLVPQYQGVGATGRGRQCSLRRRVSRGASGGKTKARGCFNWGGGERRPRFHLCLGSLSQVRCSGRGKWLSSLPLPPTPHPSLPGGRAGSAGHGELGHRLRAFGCRPEPAWVQGKVRGSCRGCCVRWERSCARGRGTLGWRARGRVERCVPRGLSRGRRGTGGVYVPRLG